MMTSKDQEREALAKIKKIVEDLGDDSYIGTAFEGCFEVAEQNIEYDFAVSYKQQADILRTETEKLRDELASKERQVKDMNDTVNLARDCTLKKIEVVEICRLLNMKRLEAQHIAEMSTKEILEHISNTDGEEFKDARQMYKNAEHCIKKCEEYEDRLWKIGDAVGNLDAIYAAEGDE